MQYSKENIVRVSYTSILSKFARYAHKLVSVDFQKKVAHFTAIILDGEKVKMDCAHLISTNKLSVKRHSTSGPILTYADGRTGRVLDNGGKLDNFIFLKWTSPDTKKEHSISLKELWDYAKERNLSGIMFSDDVLFFLCQCKNK